MATVIVIHCFGLLRGDEGERQGGGPSPFSAFLPSFGWQCFSHLLVSDGGAFSLMLLWTGAVIVSMTASSSSNTNNLLNTSVVHVDVGWNPMK